MSTSGFEPSLSCADPENFARGSPTMTTVFFFFFFFFFFMRAERIKITLKEGHYRPASETPFK